MTKLNIITTVDNALFGELKTRTFNLYQQARKEYNDGFPFTYKMYTGAGFTRYPTPATVKFLDSFKEEIEPQTEMRRAIIAFLTQFLNLCIEERAIALLLPSSLSDPVVTHVDKPHCESDIELVEAFKRRPEYKLIKRKLVLNTL